MKIVVKVLFVCTGNTCRSPMAEYYFKDFFGKIEDENFPQVIVESCGTMAYGDGLSSQGTKDVLTELEIDSASHRSQIISEALVNSADIVIAMSYMHYHTVKNFLHNDHYMELMMLSDLIEGEMGRDVPDPIGGSLDAYMNVLKYIKKIEEPLKDLIIKVARRKQELL